MAMTMNGQVQLPAARQVVWEKLNDPEVLKSCIPGSEQLDRIGDNEFQAIATVKVGPVKARWKGKVRLTDLDPPNSYRISGEGEGGVARSSPMTWRRRSAASSPSSASVSSTVRRRRPPTISSSSSRRRWHKPDDGLQSALLKSLSTLDPPRAGGSESTCSNPRPGAKSTRF